MSPADQYPPALRELLGRLPLAPLGPGLPDQALKSKLDAALEGPVVDGDMAVACRAALFLGSNFLDESHNLSQGLHTVEGSYWHALMHRREPDFANAKYWFRRVGRHPVFEGLASAAAQLAASSAEDRPTFLTGQSAWDPFAFVDECEAALGQGSPAEMLCRQIQQREWEILFAYCYQRAFND